MSYYDSTVGWYDSQISSKRQTIASFNSQIMALEDDIEDLRRLKIRVGDVESAVTAAAKSSSDRVGKLPELVLNPRAILRISFFSQFIYVIKGPEHTRAKNAVGSAIEKINVQIEEFQNRIDNMQDSIRECNEAISSIAKQRSNYIAKAEASKAEQSSQQDNRAAT